MDDALGPRAAGKEALGAQGHRRGGLPEEVRGRREVLVACSRLSCVRTPAAAIVRYTHFYFRARVGFSLDQNPTRSRVGSRPAAKCARYGDVSDAHAGGPKRGGDRRVVRRGGETVSRGGSVVPLERSGGAHK